MEDLIKGIDAKLQEKIDDSNTSLYITSGVLGGICLVLIILVIVLFVLHSKQQRVMRNFINDWEKWGKGAPIDGINGRQPYQSPRGNSNF